MKSIYIFIMILVFTSNSFSQEILKKSVSEASDDLANKLILKNKKNVVVLYVTERGGAETNTGMYIADIISDNLVNNPANFEVFERSSLPNIIEAKKLIAEGYIDIYKAKELGKLLAVEVIIVGNYTVLDNKLDLRLQAFDSKTGQVTASNMNILPIDSDAGVLLGITVEQNGRRNNANRGFNNQPLNSNEDYNNPRTVNPGCKKNDTGDYCFTNTMTTTPFTIIIYIGKNSNTNKTMNVLAGQTQCLYDLPAGPHNYVVTYRARVPMMSFPPGAPTIEKDVIYLQGQINVEQCKSKTFVIKK